jgi:hypothetical protein
MNSCSSSNLRRHERSHLRSLFIVSLPRSLSTLIHYQCSLKLGLRSPIWADAGEILNADSFLISSNGLGNEADKFTPPEQTIHFARLTEFLDDVINPQDCIYKDVVQPFVVSQWLRGSNLAVLHIRRPVAEVVWAMLRRGWFYPGNVEPQDRSQTARLIGGLVKAARALDRIDAEHVDFDLLTSNEEELKSALRRLYPRLEIPAISYIDRDFRERKEILESERYEDPEWPVLAQEVAAAIRNTTVE